MKCFLLRGCGGLTVGSRPSALALHMTGFSVSSIHEDYAWERHIHSGNHVAYHVISQSIALYTSRKNMQTYRQKDRLTHRQTTTLTDTLSTVAKCRPDPNRAFQSLSLSLCSSSSYHCEHHDHPHDKDNKRCPLLSKGMGLVRPQFGWWWNKARMKCDWSVKSWEARLLWVRKLK